MKDMYSFARTQKEHDEIYEKVAAAYVRVYTRLGIGDDTFRTAADGGYFTDRYSDEFQTISDIGEDLIFKTVKGKYFNREVAPSKIPTPNTQEAPEKYEEVKGEGIIGVAALLKHLHIPIEKSTKTLFYETDTGEIIVAAVRSDYEVNEIKLCKVLGCKSVHLANEATVQRLTGATIGYAGIVHLPKSVRVVLDDSLEGLSNFETGSNKTGYHSINVNFGRDVKAPERFYDVKVAKDGDLDPASDQPMETYKAVEVGNIFPLETKYTDALGVYYVDEKGSRQSIIMGCYGIGISRIMGVIAEHFADEKGLAWPDSVAPFKVHLVLLGNGEEATRQADKLYSLLTELKISILYDNRNMRPGEKLADADLIGIPHRVVVSDKTARAGTFEYKARTSDVAKQFSEAELVNLLHS